jgi:hypothetical protein
MILRLPDVQADLRRLTNEELIWLADRITAERRRRDICEHGIVNEDWCEFCNREYKLAASSREEEA